MAYSDSGLNYQRLRSSRLFDEHSFFNGATDFSLFTLCNNLPGNTLSRPGDGIATINFVLENLALKYLYPVTEKAQPGTIYHQSISLEDREDSEVSF